MDLLEQEGIISQSNGSSYQVISKKIKFYMKNVKTSIILRIVAILMLFWALTDNPYVYYQILRWMVSGITGYLAYTLYKQKGKMWMWILGVIAILFNPIAPIYINHETWAIIDVITAIIIFISLFKVEQIKINIK